MTTWLSENPMWEAFGSRALFWAASRASDFGEVRTTIDRVGDGSADDWHREWNATAARVEQIGDDATAKGHRVSAREAYLRAATYHRTAYYPLFGPTIDARFAASSALEWESTQKAAALFDPPIEVVQIPFENTTLPGLFVRAADDDGRPRPTIVHTNGYDSTFCEMLAAHGLSDRRRGYHAVLFDGPGQGRALVDQGLKMRPEWEQVVTSVIDYVVTLPEVDVDRLALVGWSFGGFLAPRAAAFEPRLAALLADPGQWDQRDALMPRLPLSDADKAAFPDIDRSALDPMREWLDTPDADPMLRWRMLQRGPLVHGVDDLFDVLAELARFELSSVAGQIACPTLLTMPEGDPTAAGAALLFDALTVADKELVRFRADEGAGGHCEGEARSLYDQRTLDWLDERLAGSL